MANGVLGEIPSSGYNPARIAIDPNDPDYLKKMAMVGALEGHHEMNTPSTQPIPGNKLDPASAQAAAAETEKEKPPVYPTEGAKMTPYEAAQGITPATTRLMHKAEGIQSKPLRILGEIGAGLTRGAEAVGTAMFPGVAGMIPGSMLNTALKKDTAFEQTEQQLRQQLAAEKEREEADYRRQMASAATQRASTGEERAQAYSKDLQDKLTNKLGAQGYAPQFDENGMLSGVERVPGYQAKQALKPAVNPKTGKTEYFDTANKEWTGLETPEKTPSWTAVVDPRDPTKSIFVDRTTKQPTGFSAPPSWSQAMVGTRITTMMDPESGVPAVFQYNSQTGRYDKYAGVSAGSGIGAQTVTADRALSGVQDTVQLVNELAPELGPVMGRWNDFMAGDVGATPTGPDGKPDPRFEALRTNMAFVAAAAAKFHLNSVRAVQEFTKLADAGKMTPELLNAYLNTVGQWAEKVETQSKGRAAGDNKSTPSKSISLNDFLNEK